MLRAQTPVTRAAFLAWGESQMQPIEDILLKSVDEGMQRLATLIRQERPDLAPGYFRVVRAGQLQIGVGSALTRKAPIRVQGPSVDREDDVLLEAKEAAVRQEALSSLVRLESRLRKEASSIVEELLAGWREPGTR